MDGVLVGPSMLTELKIFFLGIVIVATVLCCH